MIHYWIFPTILGDACIVASKKGICQLILPGWSREKILNYVKDNYSGAKPGQEPAPTAIKNAIEFVANYFLRKKQKYRAKLDLSSLSEFQKQVFSVVSRIKPGETRSYSWVAIQVGKPNATRAVAQALAHNPVPLFIPCHRVIGKDGSARGFSAPGGVTLKKYLLKLETEFSGAKLRAKSSRIPVKSSPSKAD